MTLIEKLKGLFHRNKLISKILYKKNLILHKERQFINLDDFCSKYPKRIEFLRRDKNRFYYSDYDNDTIRLKVGDIVGEYVVKLSNVYCCAGSDTILLNNKYLYNEYKVIKRLLDVCNCTDYKIFFEDGNGNHITKYPKETETIDLGIYLSGTFSFNYFHFSLAILPKLLNDEVIPKNVPVIVDEDSLKYSSFQELIKCCNRYQRDLKIIRHGVKYMVKSLYLISSPLFMPLNVIKNTVMLPIHAQFNLDTMKKLREQVMQFKDNSKIYPKRVFISRKRATGGRQYNERECGEVALRFGFEIVFVEDYSLSEQIALFNNAEFIIGGSGAAFTNLLYCSTNCHVICLFGYSNLLSYWSTLASMNGAHYNLLYDKSLKELTKENNPLDIHKSFVINTQELEDLLMSLGLCDMPSDVC